MRIPPPGPVTASFAAASYAAAEGESVEITVTLDPELGREVTIPIQATGASADLYDLSARSLTFGPGQTRQSFMVTAVDDDADANPESVNLTLAFGALPAGIRAGAQPDATVTLTDNDDPSVTVTFDETGGSVVIAAGESEGTIRVTVTDDDLSEPAETFLFMAAAGTRGELLSLGGVDLALKADVFQVRLDADGREELPETEAEASRLRLALDGRKSIALGGGARLRGAAELGVRVDGGDAETGVGTELGASVGYAHPAGLNVVARGRFVLGNGENESISGARASRSPSIRALPDAASSSSWSPPTARRRAAWTRCGTTPGGRTCSWGATRTTHCRWRRGSATAWTCRGCAGCWCRSARWICTPETLAARVSASRSGAGGWGARPWPWSSMASGTRRAATARRTAVSC